MLATLNLFNNIVDFFIWAILLSALMSWLIGFNILNINNKLIYIIADFLNRLTEPFLSPIRRILPYLGGIDLSPVILILLLIFLKDLINNNYYDFINKLN
jgi:YggT family protein